MELDLGGGKRQNVHTKTKRQVDPDEIAKIEARKNVGVKSQDDRTLSNKKWLQAEFSTEKKFSMHIEKHLNEYGSINQDEYLNIARRLLAAPLDEDVGWFISHTGFIFKHRISTNDLAIGRGDGYISTLYKPIKGQNQWLEQIKKHKKGG